MVLDEKFFERVTIEELPQAFRLARVLTDMYHPTSVSDMGCATGLYLVPFYAKGIDVYGYDNGTEAKGQSLLKDGLIQWVDVTCESFVPATKTDIAICLEVLEHIPEKDADAAIRALVSMSDVIVFSAAIPGQGGDGHINCQFKPYWVIKFAHHGYTVDMEDTERLRNAMARGYHMGWFTQNVMVLKKRAA